MGCKSEIVKGKKDGKMKRGLGQGSALGGVRKEGLRKMTAVVQKKTRSLKEVSRIGGTIRMKWDRKRSEIVPGL